MGAGTQSCCLSASVSSGQIHPELLLLQLPSLSGRSAEEEREEERDEEQPGTVAAAVCGGAPSRSVLCFYVCLLRSVEVKDDPAAFRRAEVRSLRLGLPEHCWVLASRFPPGSAEIVVSICFFWPGQI